MELVRNAELGEPVGEATGGLEQAELVVLADGDEQPGAADGSDPRRVIEEAEGTLGAPAGPGGGAECAGIEIEREHAGRAIVRPGGGVAHHLTHAADRGLETGPRQPARADAASGIEQPPL